MYKFCPLRDNKERNSGTHMDQNLLQCTTSWTVSGRHLIFRATHRKISSDTGLLRIDNYWHCSVTIFTCSSYVILIHQFIFRKTKPGNGIESLPRCHQTCVLNGRSRKRSRTATYNVYDDVYLGFLYIIMTET